MEFKLNKNRTLSENVEAFIALTFNSKSEFYKLDGFNHNTLNLIKVNKPTWAIYGRLAKLMNIDIFELNDLEIIKK